MNERRVYPPCDGPCRLVDGEWDCVASAGTLLTWATVDYDPFPWQEGRLGIPQLRHIASWPRLADCDDCMKCQERELGGILE